MEPNAPATAKQVELLIRLGVKPEIASMFSKNEACIEINSRLNQPTIRQKILLLKRGVPNAVIETLTKEEASQWISEILARR